MCYFQMNRSWKITFKKISHEIKVIFCYLLGLAHNRDISRQKSLKTVLKTLSLKRIRDLHRVPETKKKPDPTRLKPETGWVRV